MTGVRPGELHGSPMSSFNDHRVLMSLAVAASKAEGTSSLTYPRAYRISYPTFLEAMNGVGLDMEVGDALLARVDRDDRVDAATSEPTDLGEDTGTPATQEAPDAALVTSPDLPELVGVDAEPLVLSEKVRTLSEQDPDGLAVVEVGGVAPVETTWKQLQDEADRVSALLLELGVRRGESVEQWLSRADAALYEAKRCGRDRVVLAADEASVRA